MLDNITIGRYYQTNSKIHQMHPLSKIIITILIIILSFISNTIPMLAFIFTLVLLTIGLSNIPIKIYGKALLGLKWIILFLILMNLICNVPITNTVIICLRFIIIIEMTTVLTLTTLPTEITYGLELLLLPLGKLKIPIHKFALSISLALRFIPTILKQANKILKSQASRGMDYYNSSISEKIKAVLSILMPMFTLTLKKADQLADTMEVRLYNVNKKRTNYHMNQWQFTDTYLVMIHSFIFIFVVVSEVII